MGRVSERQRVRALIERAGVAMLMNIDRHGSHIGRPMLPLFLDDDPHIYFLTHESSPKVKELMAHPRVGLTVVSAHAYVVVTGSASSSRDPALIRRLWHPTYRAWFPDGTDDREATALQIAVERVRYWEPPRSRLVRVAQAARAVITRRAVETPVKTLDGL